MILLQTSPCHLKLPTVPLFKYNWSIYPYLCLCYSNKTAVFISATANFRTLQVALIQMPVLVAMSAFFMLFPDSEGAKTPFTLIFPTLVRVMILSIYIAYSMLHCFIQDLVAVFFGVIVLNYLSINGKTNYFEGASLLLIYTLLAASFFWIPSGEGS